MVGVHPHPSGEGKGVAFPRVSETNMFTSFGCVGAEAYVPRGIVCGLKVKIGVRGVGGGVLSMATGREWPFIECTQVAHMLGTFLWLQTQKITISVVLFQGNWGKKIFQNGKKCRLVSKSCGAKINIDVITQEVLSLTYF